MTGPNGATIGATGTAIVVTGRAKTVRQGEGRPQGAPERQQEHAAEGGEGRRPPPRFQQNEQPEFLRRPVRRARSEGDEPAGPAKDEPSRD